VVEPRLAVERRKREQFTRYGQLFVFRPGAVPRIRSLINGCGQDFCPGRASIQLWSRTSGVVRLTLRLQNLGGRAQESGFAGYTARAGRTTARYDRDGEASLAVRAGPGTHRFVIESRQGAGDPVSFDILAADYAVAR
jgi:hypothetical protein